MSLGLTVIVIGLYLKLKALMCEIITTGNLNKQLFICFVTSLHFFFKVTFGSFFSFLKNIFSDNELCVTQCLFLC